MSGNQRRKLWAGRGCKTLPSSLAFPSLNSRRTWLSPRIWSCPLAATIKLPQHHPHYSYYVEWGPISWGGKSKCWFPPNIFFNSLLVSLWLEREFIQKSEQCVRNRWERKAKCLQRREPWHKSSMPTGGGCNTAWNAVCTILLVGSSFSHQKSKLINFISSGLVRILCFQM